MNQDLFSEASIGMRYNNLDRESHRSELELSKIDRNKKNPIGKERHTTSSDGVFLMEKLLTVNSNIILVSFTNVLI